MRGSTRQIARCAIAAGVLLALWVVLAPQQLGGSATFAVVNGVSMQPLLHEGDVAVIRERDSYEPGDVIAYDSPQLGTVVLHRIVERRDGLLILKGDNNDWLDAERPPESAVIGELQWHVPKVGGALLRLREPRTAALAVGVLTFFVFGLAPERGRPQEATAAAAGQD